MSASEQTIAFLGLGVMGFPMAGHLARHGHRVTVYNRTREKAQKWTDEYGGARADTPAQAVEKCTFAMMCVGNDDDVRSVALGEHGAVVALPTGAIFIDHTTASATVARELDQACRLRSCGFLDAPVSGGQAGAQKGALTVMCGGEIETYQRARPVLEAYAKATTLIGGAGSGQLAKMVNQICIAGLVEGLAEGLHFAQRAGLDPALVIGAISKGAAQSWQMENRYQTMLADDYDHGFAVEWMRKDLGIALDQASKCGASLPVTALVDQFYSEIEAVGGRRWDTSSLLARLKGK